MVSERLRTRLVRREAVLALIDQRRSETGKPNLGWALEKKLLDLELADLESATAAQESIGPAPERKVLRAKTDT